MNLKELIEKATTLRDEVQAAVSEGEHIIATAKGDVATGQLVTAAGALHTAVQNLENHAVAAARILKENGAPVETQAEQK